jgi:glutaredoxin
MKRLFVLLACAAAAPSFAWDPVSVFNNAVQGQVNQQIRRGVNEAFRSITTPSTGTADPHTLSAPGAGQAARPDGTNIVVYSADWCPVCRQALAYLNSHNIQYVLNDIERDPAARAQYDELVRTRQARGVPMIFVGSETLNGWSAGAFEAMRRRLEARKAAEQASTAQAGAGQASGASAGANPTSVQPAGAVANGYTAGDVLIARIARVKLLAEAQPAARPVGQLARNEEVIYLGEAQGRYLRVRSADLEGWADQALLGKP